MKILLAATAVAVMTFVAPQAQAADNRISVHEIHALVEDLNKGLNNPDAAVGRSLLNRLIADNAAFDNNQNVYTPHWSYQNVWYGQAAANPYYYRYPYAVAPHKASVSTRSMTKWEEIGQFENKKRLIPGYESQISLTNINMAPYARSAVIDVDMKEFSISYTPYAPYHQGVTGKIAHANSKCKLYITKQGQDLSLTRMDCNTNTSLPL